MLNFIYKKNNYQEVHSVNCQ